MSAPNKNFFLALPLPDFVRKLLEERAHQLRSEYSFKSWVSSADYHITLVFLGKEVFGDIKSFGKELSPVITHHPTFRIGLGRIGTFGKKGKPSVLWNGVRADKTMYDLQRDLHKKCTDLGFDLDDRPFHPHITLARKWNSTEKLDPSKLESNINGDEGTRSWTASEVVLYRSQPNTSPKYQVAERFPLCEQ